MYKQNNTALKILNYLIAIQLNLKLSNIKNKLQKLVRADLASYSIIKAFLNVLAKFKIAKSNRDNTKY
jgi:glutamate formiminotransferase